MARSIFDDQPSNSGGLFSQGERNTAFSIAQPQGKPLSLTGLIAATASNRILQKTMNEATRGHCQALLVKTALDNVAALSSLEAHLQRVAPTGTERYRMILDAYSISLAMRLTRGWLPLLVLLIIIGIVAAYFWATLAQSRAEKAQQQEESKIILQHMQQRLIMDNEMLQVVKTLIAEAERQSSVN